MSQRFTPPPNGRLVRRTLDSYHGEVIARRYRITQALGFGGMGAVYAAVDLRTGREVALKALPAGTYDQIALRRLRMEAEMASRVASEFVCAIDHLAVEAGEPFIVMERLHGETLRERLRRVGRLSLRDGMAVAVQLLRALHAVHRAGVLHRDVKPANIFVLADCEDVPRIKLIDFGLAKPLSIGDRSEEAKDGGGELGNSSITNAQGASLLGTLRYFAPEQVLGTRDIDHRIDVYAAGVTIYAALTGRHPLDGVDIKSMQSIVDAIVLDDPPRITDVCKDVPELLDDVLAMAMAKDRHRRFASARAFERALMGASGTFALEQSGTQRRASEPIRTEKARSECYVEDEVTQRRRPISA